MNKYNGNKGIFIGIGELGKYLYSKKIKFVFKQTSLKSFSRFKKICKTEKFGSETDPAIFVPEICNKKFPKMHM